MGLGTLPAYAALLSCFGALRNLGLTPRMPRRTNVAFIRLAMPVRLPTGCLRSRVGHFASSSSSVGYAAVPFSPRGQPSWERLRSPAARVTLRCSWDERLRFDASG